MVLLVANHCGTVYVSPFQFYILTRYQITIVYPGLYLAHRQQGDSVHCPSLEAGRLAVCSEVEQPV